MRGLRRALACGAATAALVVFQAHAAELALKRVLLSSGGVGLYEYEATVEGDATVELKAPLDQIDDILKSLVVFDDHGGVGGLDLAGTEPLAETFRALPFTAADLTSTPRLLNALRGAEVELAGPRALAGRIVAVVEETDATAKGEILMRRHRVTLAGETGLEQFVLEEAEGLRFTDQALRDSVTRALAAVASEAQRDARVIRLKARGQGERKLHVAYLASAPVWKTSYRLVLDGDRAAKTATLQGWAILENFSGQDWSNVDLTLVSGRPVAYRQALYRVYKTQRPEAPVDLGAQLTPGVDSGAMDAAKPTAPPPPATMAAPAPRAKAARGAAAGALAESMRLSDAAPEPQLSPAAEAAVARDSETQVAFHLPFPVSVGNGRTLSLPIVDAAAPVERVAIFDPKVDARHPLSAAEFTNAGKAALPPGIVTIYENGAGGAAYVGDSRLSPTPGGETRLLAYALDSKTTVEEDDSDSSSLSRARIAKGVLSIEDVTRRHAAYKVKALEPRRLVVFAPKLDGGRLTEPDAKGVKEAEGRYRIGFDVAAGQQTLDVRQERTDTRAVALGSLDETSLAVYAKAGEVDAESRAALARLADLRAKESALARAVEETESRIENVEADQKRLKDLLGAVSSGTDLAKRYLRKLDADETELEQLSVEKTKREKARDEAARAVESYVAGL